MHGVETVTGDVVSWLAAGDGFTVDANAILMSRSEGVLRRRASPLGKVNTKLHVVAAAAAAGVRFDALDGPA